MSEKKGGHVCAVKNCKNKRYNCDKSFFSFPSDPNRARIWIMKCHREDLLENLNSVDKRSRLCENHFEPRMFTNHLRNRLNKNAVPTLFPSLEGSLNDFSDHTYSQPMLVTSNINFLQDTVLCPTDVSENNPEEKRFKLLNQTMDASEKRFDDKLNLKMEIKHEDDITLETVPIKDEPWPIDLNKIKPEPDSLGIENETNCFAEFVTDSELQSIINVKTERKCDDENGIACELAQDVEWEEHTKEKIEHIDDDVVESLYNIKHEDVEVKFENYSDTSLQSFKDELDDCRTAESMNDSKLQHNKKQYGSDDRDGGLKHRVSSKKQTYECSFCNFKTIFKGYLKTHQLKHADIPEDQMYKCESCEYKTIYKQNLTKHLLTHKDIPEEQLFKCDWCEFKTGQKLYLKRHEHRRHTDVPKKEFFKCDSCDFKTTAKDYLPRHQLSHEDIPEEQMLKCDMCDYKTVFKKNLKKHQLRHKNIPEEQMFKCDSCDYKAICKSYVTKHQLKHTEEQMLKCNLCDYKTVYKSNLKMHQLKHTSIRKQRLYQCESCDYKTKVKYSLTLHQLRHKDIPEEQMFKCDLCDYKTILKTYLKIHQLKHKGQMYVCDLCDFKTVYKCSLTKHQLTHKDVPEEQMHKCDLCNYKTVYRYNLTKHRSKHLEGQKNKPTDTETSLTHLCYFVT